MPSYRVLLSGTVILIPISDGADPITGFYTARQVEAPDPVTAQSIAVARVAEEWSQGEYASANLGNAPAIEVDDTWQVRWWQRLRWRRFGSVFYGQDPTTG